MPWKSCKSHYPAACYWMQCPAHQQRPIQCQGCRCLAAAWMQKELLIHPPHFRVCKMRGVLEDEHEEKRKRLEASLKEERRGLIMNAEDEEI